MTEKRGTAQNLPAQRDRIGLPYRPFLYTTDQIAVLLEVDEKKVKADYLYFEGRSIGVSHRGLMIARNIAPADQPPDWRVAERELIRWMKTKGFKYYERGVTSY